MPRLPLFLARRPRTRAECEGHDGPCPWVTCRHHLALDVHGTRATLHADPLTMTESCALDAAARGGMTLEAVAKVLRLSNERVWKIEQDALAHCADRLAKEETA